MARRRPALTKTWDSEGVNAMTQETELPGPRVCDHEEACGCYVEGYSAGYRKACDEILDLIHSSNHLPAPHIYNHPLTEVPPEAKSY